VCGNYQRWHLDSHTIGGLEGERGGDRIDDVVEIVVIPVTAHPRGVGRIGKDDRRERGEQCDQEQREDTTGEQHDVMIALLVGAVKNRVVSRLPPVLPWLFSAWNASERPVLMVVLVERPQECGERGSLCLKAVSRPVCRLKRSLALGVGALDGAVGFGPVTGASGS
jgi:hypothetical protein